MKRELTAEQLAIALGVTERTVWRWLERGCPSDEEPRRFDAEEVRAWCVAHGLQAPTAPSTPPSAEPGAPSRPSPPPSTPPITATLATAELARRLTVARKNELELQAEKGLKELGLGEKIRAAQTHADLLEYTKQVIDLVGSGAMTPERGRTLQGLVTTAGRHMKARHAEGAGAPERILLTTEEGWSLLEAFEGIVSDARRARLVELVLAAAAEDAEENPNADLAAGLPEEPEVPPADELEEEQP